MQNDIIRWVSGFNRKDRMHVNELRKQLQIRTIEDSLCCRRSEWLGHLIRMNGNRLVGRVCGSECVGSRARGRPRWIYKKQEMEDLARGGLSRLEALDRGKWKAAVGKIGKPQ